MNEGLRASLQMRRALSLLSYHCLLRLADSWANANTVKERDQCCGRTRVATGVPTFSLCRFEAFAKILSGLTRPASTAPTRAQCTEVVRLVHDVDEALLEGLMVDMKGSDVGTSRDCAGSLPSSARPIALVRAHRLVYRAH